MDPSEPRLPIPADIDEARLREWVTDYAPVLRFDRRERHFPSDPDKFKDEARFRESRANARDKGWNKVDRRWVAKDARGPEYFAAAWSQIASESLKGYPAPGTFEPWHLPNFRPRDKGSIDARDRRTTADGLFLERDDRLIRTESGAPPRNGLVTAPVYVDVAYHRPSQAIRVLYWFFYELNWWGPLLTHEGDWEHMSLIAHRDRVVAGDPPEIAYFATHNEGEFRHYDALDHHGRHPVGYVDRDGHPTHPHVNDPASYPVEWRTWDTDVRYVVEQEWRDYAGAWGEVGNTATTTGPLGPLFKRNGDHIRLTLGPSGRLSAKLKRK